MHSTVRWSTRVVGVALGLSVVAALPMGAAWSAASEQPSSHMATSSPTSAAGSTSTEAPDDLASARYRWGDVVAGDEFNYTGAPDSSKWRVYRSRGHAGKGLRSPDAWRVDGTAATITGDSQGRTGGMSSRYGQKTGRWEARMKVSLRDPKYHPVLLLWPDMPTDNCPEVNFAESLKDRNKVNFFLHYGCEPRQVQTAKSLDMTTWHNYAVEWTPTSMTGYIDGVRYFENDNRKYLPKVSMHACIQLDWMPNDSDTRKTTMTVDWIRVYKAS